MKHSKTCECKYPLVTDEDGYCSNCARYTAHGPMPEPPPTPTIEEAVALVEEGHSVRSVCLMSGYSPDQLHRVMKLEHERKRKRESQAKRKAKAKAQAAELRSKFPELGDKKYADDLELFGRVARAMHELGHSWVEVGEALGTGGHRAHGLADPAYARRYENLKSLWRHAKGENDAT